jgi:hypothetical protein
MIPMLRTWARSTVAVLTAMLCFPPYQR